MADIYDDQTDGGLLGYYARHLENVFTQAMEYLNHTYMSQPSSLLEVHMSDEQLADQAYYSAMAADTVANYYAAQNRAQQWNQMQEQGWGEAPTHDENGVSYGRLVF